MLQIAHRTSLIVVTALLAAACSRDKTGTASGDVACDAGLKLPPGFCAVVFADTLGPARHLAVRRNGDVIVGVLDQRREPGGVVALRDTNHDGRADVGERW